MLELDVHLQSAFTAVCFRAVGHLAFVFALYFRCCPTFALLARRTVTFAGLIRRIVGCCLVVFALCALAFDTVC